MLITNFWLKYVLYKVVLAQQQLLDVGRLHPARDRAVRALKSSVDYLEANMFDAVACETQKDLLAYAVSQVSVPGELLECGVFSGGTIRQLARLCPDATIHGFDSFEGLPEAWAGFDLGRAAFSRQGRLPRVPRNVRLYKGWFRDTLPIWLRENGGKVAFLHIDCDIYSSTVDVLDALAARFQPGSIVLFDEYFNYPNWERHEFKAWREFVASRGVTYEYLGYARQQVAIRITDLQA